MRSFFHPSLHCRRRQEDEEEHEITAAAAVACDTICRQAG